MEEHEAIGHIQSRVDEHGYFDPDKAKTTMKRVAVQNIPPSPEVAEQQLDAAQIGEAVGREWHEPGNLFNDRRGYGGRRTIPNPLHDYRGG